MPWCTIIQVLSVKNSVVFREYYKLRNSAILCGLFGGQDLWVLSQYYFSWQKWTQLKIPIYVNDRHLYLYLNGTEIFALWVLFYMNCESRAPVTWPIMLVPVSRPIASYFHSWFKWSKERHILKCKKMATWDFALEKQWIQVVSQAVLENFHERDTILNISKLRNSFYNNSNDQSKPHIKLTWIQKYQIKKSKWAGLRFIL